MAYDRKLCADVLNAFISSIRRSLRNRAKRELGLRSVEDAQFGAITFIQRVDSSLRLNVHFHSLVLDGVYVHDEAGGLHFHALPGPTAEQVGPTAEQVAEVARWTRERIVRVFERHSRPLEGLDEAPDELAQEQPALASCYAASVSDRQLLGASPGQRTGKFGASTDEARRPVEALADVGGINIHAGPPIDGRDRRRLERLCRYVARPPMSQEHLELAPDGRIVHRFKRAWRDGTHSIALDPLDFIARLVAMIHRRAHTWFGTTACSRPTPKPDRKAEEAIFSSGRVVPQPKPEPVEPTQMSLAFLGESSEHPPSKLGSRHPWAYLLRRVFAVDVTTCLSCGGSMKLLKIAEDPDDIARALAEVGLGPRPPPQPRPALPGQLEFDFSAA